LRDRFDYRTVILLGNNIQGSGRPQDFLNKFELPYRRLLDQGVAFRPSVETMTRGNRGATSYST